MLATAPCVIVELTCSKCIFSDLRANYNLIVQLQFILTILSELGVIAGGTPEGKLSRVR